ncbi:hypothetical protein J2T13_000919 [Paenibacillus sp. DS2015]|uniref:hypothetical protein n=1 Tax=Paenibacillus sp. DS2015 TaxID=3373917 RepID=UPI003D22F148
MSRVLAGLIVFALLLSGCGGEASFPADDMAIYKTGNKKKVVRYGMSRVEAEKVLGEEEKPSGDGYLYDSGVAIFYRDDKVAGIRLDKESKKTFQTKNIKIGMLEDDVKKKYGNITMAVAPLSLDYYYDTLTKKFLDDPMSLPKSQEGKENIYIISNTIDESGSVECIYLFDLKMALYGK